jgi:RNA-binding protein
MLTLTADQRRELRARAHSLNPTVMIGAAGLTVSVLEEIAHSLDSHGLIKIRVMSDDRAGRVAALEQICTQLNAAAVQHIGKILVVYRPAVEKPARKPAARKRKPLTKKRLGNRS